MLGPVLATEASSDLVCLQAEFLSVKYSYTCRPNHEMMQRRSFSGRKTSVLLDRVVAQKHRERLYAGGTGLAPRVIGFYVHQDHRRLQPEHPVIEKLQSQHLQSHELKLEHFPSEHLQSLSI